MKRKKQISVGKHMFLSSNVAGWLWIGAGLTNMISTTFFDVLRVIFLSLGTVLLVILFCVDCEEEDEMSDFNYMKAKAKTRDIMHVVYCVSAIAAPAICAVLELVITEWYRVFVGLMFILMGMQVLITGIVFRRLEAE